MRKLHQIASDFLPEHAIFFLADLKRTNIALREAPPMPGIDTAIDALGLGVQLKTFMKRLCIYLSAFSWKKKYIL